MSIVVNGTTIPTTEGSLKVGSTNITKVNVVKDGTTTTVWQVSNALETIYLIKNGISQYTVSDSTHKATTETMSNGLTYTLYNNGSRVEFINDNEVCDIDIYIKFPIKTDSYLGRSLFLLGSFYAETTDENSKLSSATLRLACFDNNNNAVQLHQIADIDAGGNPNLSESWDGVGSNSYWQLPTSGSYYIGYIIRANGSTGAKFVLDINQLYIE